MSLILATAVLATAQIIPPVQPPRPPRLGFPLRLISLDGPSGLTLDQFGSNGVGIGIRRGRFGFGTNLERRVLLYGIATPRPGEKGYSGAMLKLENLVGRRADVFLEQEPANRNKTYRGADVRYAWAWGKLLNFEMVRFGFAKVTEEGRQGKYGPLLTAAEDEARRLKEGIWADR